MTRRERIAATCTGVVLFIVAALFSVGLLMGVLDYGDAQKAGFLSQMGQMLLSVYGICSILIPAFFFTAGAFCLSARWSVQRAFVLLISVIPFFTLVAGEQISRNIARGDPSPIAFIKIIILLVIAFLLVALEYLLAITAASIIERKIHGEPIFTTPEEEENHEEPDENPAQPKAAKVNNPKEPTVIKLKTILKNKIDTAKKTVISRLPPENEVNEEDKVQEEELQFEAPKKKRRGNWSLTSEGEIKGTVKTPAAVQKEAVPEAEVAAPAPNTNDDEVDISQFDRELSPQEPEPPKDSILFEEYEEPSAQDETEDIIDSFEMESQSLTSDLFDGDTEEPKETEEPEEPIDYEITFEDESSVPDENGLHDDYEDYSEDDDINLPEIEENYYQDRDESEYPDDYEMQDIEDQQEELDEAAEYEEFPERSYSEIPPQQAPVTSPSLASFDPSSSSLEDVFARMDRDAVSAIAQETGATSTPADAPSQNVDPLAPPVVDANGNANNHETPKTAVITENGVTRPIPLPPKKKRPLGPYKIPTDLLQEYSENEYWVIDDDTRQAANNLKETLSEFKIDAEITGIRKGPVVTMFEILPAPGVKLSKISGLADNIALRLAAQSVRIVAPIPGKRAVGIEVPNADRAIVSFRECIEQPRKEWNKMSVPVVLGKDIEGETQIMDLVKTPHLLIAGSTGAGKSVCVNSMILSILYKRSPADVKMILIDPKIVELKLYNHIPHLLTPVITEPKKAMQALQYCLCEMERRYAVLDSLGCRDISNYNRKIVEQHIATEKIPYLIVIIDEFADLMATTGKQLEGVVARLCAMSRAVGIHLVLATQRPSVDVITGLIKANIPSRVAFMVAAKMDSRIIIDQVGAEKLLGKGDMLYASSTDPFPVRIQGAFVSDQEVENVVQEVKKWGEPEYIDDEIFIDDEEEDNGGQMNLFGDVGEDPLYEKALEIVLQAGKASASYIQRRLSIGYNRAARLVEEMEERGIVGPANGSKPREVIHVPQ